jgi:uncharacterized coiled-coil protein SlyX
MARITLTLNEIDDLITAYKSSLKKLRFQMDHTTQTLRDLQEMRELKKEKMTPQPKEKKAAVEGEEKVKPAKKTPGRKPGRKKKSVRSQGYRLSDWDNSIIETIRANDKPMTSGDLVVAIMEKEAAEGANPDEKLTKGKVARSLQKLANKRGTLRKHPTRGKGFAYGLGEWFFAKTGKLKKAYQ